MKEAFTKVLESERLILRQFTEEDAPFILELLNEPSFIKNIGDRKISSMKKARAYIKNGPAASYEKNGFGLYLVTLKDGGESIGMCGLIKRPGLEDVDVGYAFLPRFWSKGYAIESVQAVKQYAHDVIGLKRMVAITNPDNYASIRVLEKIGMKFEKMITLPGDDMELKFFAVEL